MREPTFLLALVIAGMTVVVIVKTIANAFAARRTGHAEVADVREQVEELERASADQAAQLADLQNRLDFAERMLAQARERAALGPGDKDK
ncbi:MAG TPA: hypothetical protein VL549_14560 [Gemmatimonadales bacterium]|jgi:hypothetical protein|nr:hypothetical protein [Gemmatimonadales bacterium]